MKSKLLTGELTHVCFERDINHPYNKTASYLGSPTLGRVDTALKHKSIDYLTNNFTMVIMIIPCIDDVINDYEIIVSAYSTIPYPTRENPA